MDARYWISADHEVGVAFPGSAGPTDEQKRVAEEVVHRDVGRAIDWTSGHTDRGKVTLDGVVKKPKATITFVFYMFK